MSETSVGTAAGGNAGASLPPMVLPQHGLTRYLRIRLEVAGGHLRWERPRTLLGLAAIGTHRLAVPLEQIRSIEVRQRPLRPARLLAALVIIVAGVVSLPWWMAVPLVVIGLWVLLVSLGPRLDVVTLSGRRYGAPVCFSHQFDADLFVEAVRDLAPSDLNRRP